MSETTITPFADPSGFSPDALTELSRSGARRLIEQAVEAELETLLVSHSGEKTADGRARLVRHGHLPEREVMTGIGPVPVKVPRVRDRGTGRKRSASPRRSCRLTCARPDPSRNCFRGFISREYRAAISRKP